MSRRPKNNPAAILKPWIVRRPNEGCQVLFPLSELDGIIDRILNTSSPVTEKRWVLRSKSSGLYWRLKDDGESEYNRLGLATTFSWHPIEGQMEDDEEAISVQVTIATSTRWVCTQCKTVFDHRPHMEIDGFHGRIPCGPVEKQDMEPRGDAP